MIQDQNQTPLNAPAALHTETIKEFSTLLDQTRARRELQEEVNELLEGNVLTQLNNFIDKRYSNSQLKTVIQYMSDTSFNLTRRIAAETCVLYAQPPQRVVSGATGENAIPFWTDLFEQLEINQKLQEAHRYYRIMGTAVIKLYSENGENITFEVMRPHAIVKISDDVFAWGKKEKSKIPFSTNFEDEWVWRIYFPGVGAFKIKNGQSEFDPSIPILPYNPFICVGNIDNITIPQAMFLGTMFVMFLKTLKLHKFKTAAINQIAMFRANPKNNDSNPVRDEIMIFPYESDSPPVVLNTMPDFSIIDGSIDTHITDIITQYGVSLADLRMTSQVSSAEALQIEKQKLRDLNLQDAVHFKKLERAIFNRLSEIKGFNPNSNTFNIEYTFATPPQNFAEVAQTQVTLYQAGLTSLDEALKTLFPKKTQDEIEELKTQIAEKSASSPIGF